MGRVSIKFTGDTSDAKRAVQDLYRELDSVGEVVNRAFSPEGFADYLVGLGSISNAMQGLTALYREFDQVSQEAFSRLEGARESTASLVQLAGSRDEFSSLQAASNQFSASAGVDKSIADQAVFSIRSAGFGIEDVGTFAQAQTIGFGAGDTARSLATLRGTLGAGELGGLEGQLSKLIAASAASPVGPGQIAEGAARSGALASQLGISDEELLSAEALLATSTGSAERGATQLQALLKSLSSEGDRFKGRGLLASIQEVSKSGIGGEDTTGAGLQKGFGSIEAFLGFAGLQSNVPQFQRVLSDVQSANSGQAFRDKLGFLGADQTAAAVAEAASAEQEKAQALERFGVERAQGLAAFNRRQVERAGQGNVLGVLAGEAIGATAQAVGVDVAAGVAADVATQGPVVAVMSRMVGLLEQVVKNTGDTAKKTGGTVGLAKPGADE